MQTVDLFSPDDLPVIVSEPATQIHKLQPITRNFYGYQQYWSFDRWVFYVTGFDDAACEGKKGMCSVLRADGSEKDVAIDEIGQIKIGKTLYGFDAWIH